MPGVASPAHTHPPHETRRDNDVRELGLRDQAGARRRRRPIPTTGARAVPIYQTTSFVFRDTAHAAALFGLEELGIIYTRIMNPTQAVFEQRIAALEGGVGALAVASGQAAQFQALLNLAENGGHIVSSASLYGGTYNQLHYTFPKLGVEVSFVDDPDDLDAWRAAIRPNTKALYGEIIGNPKGDVFDLEGVSGGRARQRHPARDRQHARDAVPLPAARARRRHRRALGDEVHRRARHVDRRHHRRRREVRLRRQRTLPRLHRARPELPRPVFSQLPEELRPAQYILKCRLQYQRDVGPAISPFNAFLFLQGLETLEPAHGAALAERARDRAVARGARRGRVGEVPGPRVEPVERAGEEVPAERARRDRRVRDQGWARGGHRSSSTRSSCTATSPTWATCAASPSTRRPRRTSSSSPTSRSATGVTADLVRLSVGIESLDDILADLEAGFRAAKGADARRRRLPVTGCVAARATSRGAGSSSPFDARCSRWRRAARCRRSPSRTRRGARSRPTRRTRCSCCTRSPVDSHAAGPAGPGPPATRVVGRR